MQMRLQKALSQAGVASRRASEQLIREGRVQVNGQVVTEMGVQVDPNRDVIVVDGRTVGARAKRQYIKLHKPRRYLSTMSDDRGRPSLGDLLPGASGLYTAGRLDFDSEGLLLLTNDGALTQRLTHPRYEHPKEYLVLVEGTPTAAALDALRTGVELEEGRTAPAEVEQVRTTPWGRAPQGREWLRFVLREGRKRQIRRMCDAVGYPVRRLIRMRIGPIQLGDLAPGEHRSLTPVELRQLRAAVGLSERTKRGTNPTKRGTNPTKRGTNPTKRGATTRGVSRRKSSRGQSRTGTPGGRSSNPRPPREKRS
jgi:23S rRNA pseudouridine2605 synthase